MGKKKVLLAKNGEQMGSGEGLTASSEHNSSSVSSVVAPTESSSSQGQSNGLWSSATDGLDERARVFNGRGSPRGTGGGQIMTPLMAGSDNSGNGDGTGGGSGLLSRMMGRRPSDPNRSPSSSPRGHSSKLRPLDDSGPIQMTPNDMDDTFAVPAAPSERESGAQSQQDRHFHDRMDDVAPPPIDGLGISVEPSSFSNGGAPLSTSVMEGESFARVQPQPVPAQLFDSEGRVIRPTPSTTSASLDLDSSKSVSSDNNTKEEDKSGDNEDNDHDEEVCFICMEGFNMNPRWTLECQCQMGISNPISVHARCIRKWKLCGKNSLCPLCRQPLPDTNVLSFQIPESLSSSLRFQKFIRASQRNIIESSDFNTMIPRIVNNWMHDHPFPPQEASKEEVVDLLVQTGLQQYADSFFSEEINGQIFGTFEREDLVDLGVENDTDIDRFMAVLKVLKGNSVCVHGMMM